MKKNIAKFHFVIVCLIILSFTLSLVVPAYAAPSLFNWDTVDYTAGALSNGFTAGTPTTDFAFTFSGATNRLAAGQPDDNSTLHGGLNPLQESLRFSYNFANTSETIVLTLDLAPSYATDISFRLFDIDSRPGVGANQVTIIGINQGNNVLPTLTNPGSCVSVAGNVATGTCNSQNTGITSGLGNVTVGFNQAVQQIVITVGTGPGAPADPGAEVIALHDIGFTPSTPTAVSFNGLSATSPSTFAALFPIFLIVSATTLVILRRR